MCSVLSVSTVHVLCCCMWLEFTTNVFTVCELRILWRHLIGMEEKLAALLSLTSHGGKCSSKSIVLGKIFHPRQNYELSGFERSDLHGK